MELEHIYALYSIKEDVKSYFYVGRSIREPSERLKEHHYAVRNKSKTEDVYKHIRENLVLCDIPYFEQEILCWCNDDEPDDCEDFYVIKLIRGGHKLMNMKRGDAKRVAEAVEIASTSEVFETVAQLHKFKEKRAEAAFARSTALREDVLAKDFHASSPVPQWLKQKFKEMEAETVEKAKKEREKAQKRAILKAAREADYQCWLAEQRHLFETARKTGEI